MVGAKESRGEGIWLGCGEVGADHQLPDSTPGFRKEGAVNKTQTWLLDISKTRSIPSKPDVF